ncbi:hypothetical protein N5C67_09570 [Comamonas thiooxydans]|uniref:hypothetical protein n=1 Tax=Comamonas thiooxydans TaxID=363952 RepID=UPI002446F2D3|nr:hypothetical protein [Comamonas thiooxydans]MDH1252898.1 hypothetical protein [Comamonas thiooxydans]
MATPQKVHILQELREQLAELELAVHEHNPSAELISRRLIARVGKITYARDRFIALSRIYSLRRDVINFNGAIANLRGNNCTSEADISVFEDAVTNGYGTVALEHFYRINKNKGYATAASLFEGLLACGQIKALQTSFEKVKDHLVVTEMGAIMPLVLQSSKIASELNINEQLLATMYDIFGAVLRERNIYWSTSSPQFKIRRFEEGGPSFMIQYDVHANAVETASLNRDIARALAAANAVAIGVSLRVRPEISMTLEEQEAALAE